MKYIKNYRKASDSCIRRNDSIVVLPLLFSHLTRGESKGGSLYSSLLQFCNNAIVLPLLFSHLIRGESKGGSLYSSILQFCNNAIILHLLFSHLIRGESKGGSLYSFNLAILKFLQNLQHSTLNLQRNFEILVVLAFLVGLVGK